MRVEVTGGWRKLHQNFNPSPNIRVTKSKVRNAGLAARMVQMSN